MAANPEDNTVPLDNSFLQTLWYNSREYSQYALTNETYHLPVDDEEVERLSIEYHVLQTIFDNRLIFPPLSRPRRVLECGYGTAQWAIALGEQFPSCQVIGLDIYPSMAPAELPENVYLQIDDLNNRFTFPAHNFDLVRSAMVVTGIHVNRWNSYLRDILKVLRGGGWAQMIEVYYNVQSDNGSLRDEHALRQWSSRYLESMDGLKDLRVPGRLHTMMRSAGFVDVEHRMIQMHTCAWSDDERNINIGTSNRENVQRMLSSIALYPFTERLGMSAADAHMLIAQARIEADNPAFKAYFPLYVVIGRKPRSHR